MTEVYLETCVNLKAGKYTKNELESIIRDMIRLDRNVWSAMDTSWIKCWLANDAVYILAPSAVEFMNKHCPTKELRENPPKQIADVYKQFGVCIEEIKKLEKML